MTPGTLITLTGQTPRSTHAEIRSIPKYDIFLLVIEFHYRSRILIHPRLLPAVAHASLKLLTLKTLK